MSLSVATANNMYVGLLFINVGLHTTDSLIKNPSAASNSYHVLATSQHLLLRQGLCAPSAHASQMLLQFTHPPSKTDLQCLSSFESGGGGGGHQGWETGNINSKLKSNFDCVHTTAKCAFWIKIRKTVFWTVCTPNHIAMRISNDGPDHNLNCACQIMHCDVIWRTHCPTYRHSNHHLNCAFQITHHDVILAYTRSKIPSFES